MPRDMNDGLVAAEIVAGNIEIVAHGEARPSWQEAFVFTCTWLFRRSFAILRLYLM
jgi:hypothetical protein